MTMSDEMVTGSVSDSEAGQTPDTEVKEMGNEGVSDGESSLEESNHPTGEGSGDEVAASAPGKPNLSREQQEWLNKVFIPNFRKELMRQVQFDRKALDRHRRDLERRKKEEEAQREAVRAAEEENERLVRTISELRIDKALVSAAAANNAVNPDQVRKLLRDRVKLGEDLEPKVLDDRGERQLNRNGEFMTVEEQVKLFLAENPHLVKASPARGGSGSTGSPGGRFAMGPTSSGDLIAEGLVEENKKPPTRTLAEFEK
jgi:hypothetical protein